MDFDARALQLGLYGIRFKVLTKDDTRAIVATQHELVYFSDSEVQRIFLRDVSKISSDKLGILRINTGELVAIETGVKGFRGSELKEFFADVKNAIGSARVSSSSLYLPPALGDSSSYLSAVPLEGISTRGMAGGILGANDSVEGVAEIGKVDAKLDSELDSFASNTSELLTKPSSMPTSKPTSMPTRASANVTIPSMPVLTSPDDAMLISDGESEVVMAPTAIPSSSASELFSSRPEIPAVVIPQIAPVVHPISTPISSEGSQGIIKTRVPAAPSSFSSPIPASVTSSVPDSTLNASLNATRTLPISSTPSSAVPNPLPNPASSTPPSHVVVTSTPSTQMDATATPSYGTALNQAVNLEVLRRMQFQLEAKANLIRIVALVVAVMGAIAGAVGLTVHLILGVGILVLGVAAGAGLYLVSEGLVSVAKYWDESVGER